MEKKIIREIIKMTFFIDQFVGFMEISTYLLPNPTVLNKNQQFLHIDFNSGKRCTNYPNQFHNWNKIY